MSALTVAGGVYGCWLLICLVEEVRYRRARRARAVAAAKRRHPSNRAVSA